MSICALIAILLAACGGGKPSASPSPSSSSARIRSTATIVIISPVEGQTVPASGVTVKIKLTGGTIVPQVSLDVKPDQGHIHLLVDGQVRLLLGSLEVPTGALSPGSHIITAEFVETSHAPFDPRVLANVTVRAA
jgi:hypothetical protein